MVDFLYEFIDFLKNLSPYAVLVLIIYFVFGRGKEKEIIGYIDKILGSLKNISGNKGKIEDKSGTNTEVAKEVSDTISVAIEKNIEKLEEKVGEIIEEIKENKEKKKPVRKRAKDIKNKWNN